MTMTHTGPIRVDPCEQYAGPDDGTESLPAKTTGGAVDMPTPDGGPAGASPSTTGTESASPVLPDNTLRVVVVGAVPQVGASGVALSVALAATGTGADVHLVDAAAPRRSSLRMVCPAEGARTSFTREVGVVTSRAGSLTVTHLDGPMDVRHDHPQQWPDPPGCDLQVIDVGVDAETLLSTEHPGVAWLDPAEVVDAWVVLVMAGSTPCLNRTEDVLARWVGRGLAPVASVVTTGPHPVQEHVRAAAGRFTGQALQLAIAHPWDQDVFAHGYLPTHIPGAFAQTGERIVAATGSPLASRLAVNAPAKGWRGRGIKRKGTP